MNVRATVIIKTSIFELMSDSELIQSILSGNTTDFTTLVERHQKLVFNTCMGFVHDADEANDLTQEVFISAFQKLSGFRGQSSFPTWLYRISVNACLTHLRDKKKRRSLFDRFLGRFGGDILEINPFPDFDSENPEQAMINAEGESAIRDALDSLPERQKAAFILSKYDNLPQKEIAEIMHLSEGAVESLLQRAKAGLHKKLSPYFKKS